jgi:hypothetical protein
VFVAWAVTVTWAPATTAPELSETVPEKLPVAWPCKSGLKRHTSAQQHTANRALLLDISEPLSVVAPRKEKDPPVASDAGRRRDCRQRL